MKTTNNRLLVILVPLLAPLTVLAEPVSTPQDGSVRAAKELGVKSDSWRASHIIGTSVKNADDLSIGFIEDLVIDYQSGEVLAAVVATGGFLGIGDTLSPIPMAALRYDGEANVFRTKLTRTQLLSAPHFTKVAWPDYGDPTVSEHFRRYSEVIVSARDVPNGTEADRNETDNHRGETTGHSSSESDLTTTRKICAAITDAHLSFSAMNVKVVTREGHVTLKGYMDDGNEHQMVIEIVRNHADSSKISDEITVDEK